MEEPQPVALDLDDRLFLGRREDVDQSICVRTDRSDTNEMVGSARQAAASNAARASASRLPTWARTNSLRVFGSGRSAPGGAVKLSASSMA